MGINNLPVDKAGNERKRVLMVIPFDIYPPINGGMHRCFNLLNQLCKHFEVTALMHQYPETLLKSSVDFPAIKKCRILSTKNNKAAKGIFSLIPSKYRDSVKFRIWNRSFSEPADTNYLLLYPQMKEFLRAGKVDYVILEDMAILPLAKLVKRYHSGVPVVYDAYNVNSVLAESVLAKGAITRKEYEKTRDFETSLSKYISKVFACSESDLILLTKMNNGKISGVVLPNGVNIPANHNQRNDDKSENSLDFLFCGSLDYFPNQEGLLWFCKEVLPLITAEIPVARLLVVGKGDPGHELSDVLKNPSIVNYGKVDKVDKYYRMAALAVIPLLSGSGTRLKLTESMAYEVAVVSTSSGAEGVNYEDGINIMIADDAVNFGKKVVELLKSPGTAKRISKAAFELASGEYDWNNVGKKMSGYLNSLH